MLSNIITWKLFEETKTRVENRNCKMCGKIMPFTDTLIRRHNCNGKSIYRYAIYKCTENHTWNKKLDTYKSHTNHVRLFAKEEEIIESNSQIISIEKYKKEGMDEIRIHLESVQGHHRIDQLLSKQIEGLSRNQIVDKLRNESILVNGMKTKPSARMKTDDKIAIFI